MLKSGCDPNGDFVEVVYNAGVDNEESIEKQTSPKSTSSSKLMTLQKAVDLGEYNPEYLSGFAEWHTLSRHTQAQLIPEAIKNRKRQLIQQWAEINNVIDFRLKPQLQQALRNIEAQRKKVEKDEERLFLEYS